VTHGADAGRGRRKTQRELAATAQCCDTATPSALVVVGAAVQRCTAAQLDRARSSKGYLGGRLAAVPTNCPSGDIVGLLVIHVALRVPRLE